MSDWLIKCDPEDYSFDDLVRDGRAVWDGVSNPQALKFIGEMRTGDRVLVYHTGDEKRIVGTASVVKDPYPDPKVKNSKRVVVDIEAGGRVPRFVTLAQIKEDPSFAEFHLVRQARLSVMPVTPGHWKKISAMAGLKPNS